MKYISEEKLREKGRFYMPDSVLLEFISKECAELDQLTVSKLRPMSEAPEFTDILAYNKTDNEFQEWYSDDLKLLNNKDFIGWIPMPIYKPEK